MIHAVRRTCRTLSKGTLCVLIAMLIALPLSAQAGNGKHKGKGHHKHGHYSQYTSGMRHGHKKRHKKNKARTTICHYEMDGTYKALSLPVHAAMKHLAKHELDKEPVVGADGTESCLFVEEPTTTCKINIDGNELSISEFIAAEQIVVTGFNTDSNSCELLENGTNLAVHLYNNSDGAGLDIFFRSNRLLIDSQAQYDDCAFDIETIAQTNENCPPVVQFNP